MATPTPSTNTPQKHLPAFSSPLPRSVPGMINYDSPAALGLSLEGGVGMGISMSGLSGLGLGTSLMGGGRGNDEEQRRRLEAVLSIIKAKPARVCKEGIMQLCKNEGLQVMEDDDTNSLAVLIGDEMIVDITMKMDIVENVALSIDCDKRGIDFGPTASKALLNDLSPLPGMSRINLSLERFANNLDRLVRMDKLSSPEANCFNALFGVYTSLKKLFEHEKKMAQALLDASSSNASLKAEREVLCKKSGRPRMNAGNQLGLRLEYWMNRRHVFSRSSRASKKDSDGKGKSSKMDIDSDAPGDDVDPETNEIYSMIIECESSPASMYPPIRVSDAWISSEIEKAADPDNIFGGPGIDWQDPPPTYLASTAPEEHDPMNLDGGPGRLPNIRFVAKLSPPLVVPLSTAMSIHQSLTGSQFQQYNHTTFIGLALRPNETIDPGAIGLSGDSTQELRSDDKVLVINKDGQEEQHHHSNSLYVPKMEYARVLDELPFHHPRQLVEILPTLRQYAFVTSLFQSTFPPPTTATPGTNSAPTTGTSESTSSLQVDLVLHFTQPIPRIRLDLPNTSTTDPSSLEAILSSLDADPPISLAIDVHANADLLVAEQNVLPPSESDGKDAAGDAVMSGEGEEKEKMEAEKAGREVRRQEVVDKVARALDVCGDIGVWAEWVRGWAEGVGK